MKETNLSLVGQQPLMNLVILKIILTATQQVVIHVILMKEMDTHSQKDKLVMVIMGMPT